MPELQLISYYGNIFEPLTGFCSKLAEITKAPMFESRFTPLFIRSNETLEISA